MIDAAKFVPGMSGLNLGVLALALAECLDHEALYYRRGQWRIPAQGGIGHVVSPVFVALAVMERLPGDIDFWRGGHLALSIVSTDAFKEAMTR